MPNRPVSCASWVGAGAACRLARVHGPMTSNDTHAAAVGRRFDTDIEAVRIRQGPGPRATLVAVHAGRPFRADFREGCVVEIRGSERRAPFDRLRRHADRHLDLRRNRVEAHEPARRIETNQGHAREQQRRIGHTDSRVVVVGHERHRAGAMPKHEGWRTPGREPCPAICAPALGDGPVEKIAVVAKAAGVGDDGIGVAEKLAQFLRAIDEDGDGLGQRHPGGQRGAIGKQRHRDHQHNRRGEPHHRPRHRHRRALTAGGGHHLRRRRLAGRQRGGERIAAGQRRRYRERRGGTARRIRLEAADDRAFDRADRSPRTTAVGSVSVPASCCATSSATVVAVNARRPVNNSYSTRPSA